ncbi:uncharacterized protein [Blastocystis hominis]|uniref:Protein tyrosine phosphatase type IVA 3 n=1 Tax=Blastocystis hominis TaxID=12968 RepID=D8M2G9_BLAHO|nr:uncharacterized protein [Blastocystis hominis]CBK22258.2 unnamed protein product [Blastocystis hominis]|eukprot:XP_012896306.1 uncharacterized protein [Blastocystis hominis]
MLIPPTFLEIEGMRFLITGMPRDFELTEFEKLYKSYNVTDVVRTCEECHYSDDWLKSQGIQSHQFVFADGSIPPEDVVTRFIGLCESRFGPESKNPKATISIHCKAGLGRAPTLVTIALIESGMKNLEAIQTVKNYRNEAFNQKQLLALTRYKPLRKNRSKPCNCCIVLCIV